MVSLTGPPDEFALLVSPTFACPIDSMATRFLLPCPCGREIPVDAGQAGDRARCECGNAVPVPKLGELRLLPRIQSAQPEKTWGPRQGIMSLCVLVAGACLILGIYFWAVTPRAGARDAMADRDRVEAFFDRLSPAETWAYWYQQSVPIARQGLRQEPNLQNTAQDEEMERGKARQTLAFGTAGVAILVFIAMALWRPRRPLR